METSIPSVYIIDKTNKVNACPIIHSNLVLDLNTNILYSGYLEKDKWFYKMKIDEIIYDEEQNKFNNSLIRRIINEINESKKYYIYIQVVEDRLHSSIEDEKLFEDSAQLPKLLE
jgi:hypothetical protein